MKHLPYMSFNTYVQAMQDKFNYAFNECLEAGGDINTMTVGYIMRTVFRSVMAWSLAGGSDKRDL